MLIPSFIITYVYDFKNCDELFARGNDKRNCALGQTRAIILPFREMLFRLQNDIFTFI
ncbi:MAG: hypothetical protein ACTS6A_01700 [Candidatus Hodgkinia cicadicola]